MKRRQLITALAAAATAVVLAPAAQAFPTGKLTIIVPYSPGSTDQLARTLAPELEKALGQSVVVETKPGAGGTVGGNFVAKSSKPDGHTMLVAVSSVQTVAPHQRELPYGFADLKPVARVTVGPNIMGARAGAPFNDLASLIAYAKANPGKVSFGSAGTGGATHLAGEAFAQAAGIKLNHIPFKGVTPAIAAAVGGNVDLVFGFASAIMPQVEGGKMVAIAQLGDKRVSGLPNLTTLKEGGIDLALPPNLGVWVPAGTPDDVVAELEGAFRAAASSDAFKAFTTKRRTEIDFLGAADFAKVLEQENVFFGKLLTSLGMAKK
ncbi:MAG: tripartite tricarboxylate transporter substrate binding protein [Burkholderiales bacterium]|nr:MAG: tripartite tricarboxylate transporter substrate binding protein [Burkholderiales bacterium]